MTASNAFLALAVATITVSRVTAFVSPPPHAPAGRVAALSAPRVKTQLGSNGIVDTPPPGRKLPLPPRDETFNPLGALRDLLVAPDAVEDAGRYDRVGSSTGGTWRSLVWGILPSTVVTFQQGAKWIVQQEAAGNVYQELPQTVVQILGEKALINLSVQPQLHAIGRKPYSEALSPKAVLELRPYLETVVNRKVIKLEGLAKSGQEVVVQDEMQDITLESIAGVFFGEYATAEFMEDIKRYLPTISIGLTGVAFRFPWPLNQLPLLAFGRSMDAREAFKFDILNVLEERRADLASVEDGSSGGKSAGLLDSLSMIQQNQMGLDEGQDGTFDDDFIVDNVILSLFAGTDTTAVTLTRILQLLATADDGKEIVDKLIQEFSNDATSDDDELDDTGGTGSGGASRAGILGAFPLLDAVILESFRMHPTVTAAFRKTRDSVSYNGYLVPAGETINWNIVHGLRADSLYPEPKKFCPFRFLHGDKINDEGATPPASPGEVPAEQPPPPMFGLGRHMCPGRELAKLEMLLFLKEFLTKFDYKPVEGQSFKGVLPANGPKDKLRVVLTPKSAT